MKTKKKDTSEENINIKYTDTDNKIDYEDYGGDVVSKCDICGSVNDKNNLKHIPDSKIDICKRCYENYAYKCYNCGIECLKGDMIYLENYDIYICDYCYENDTIVCDYCSDNVLRRHIHIVSDDEMCEYCYYYYESDEYYDEGERVINPPKYRPSLDFRKCENETTDLYIGVELEVEVPESETCYDVASSFLLYANEKEYDFIYNKEDGTLKHGFEVVTHPFTYCWYKKNRKLFSDLLRYLSGFGCKSYYTETCGINIHMSLNAISKLELYKMMKLIYGDKFTTLIISQRKGYEDINRYSSLDIREDEIVKTCTIKRNIKESKYQAINLTKRTAELRIFKGTLKEESFFKNIEFAFALKEFVENTPLDKINYYEFYKFVKEKDKKYINLVKFIENRRLLKDIVNRYIKEKSNK